MALRFRKSFKIAPGVRINLSKSGVSTSIGGKGITANLSKRGTRVTTSIPGTGISSSKLYKSGTSKRAQVERAPLWVNVIVGLAVLAFGVWIFN